MQFVILGMLLGRPLSLYELRQGFAGTVSLFYSASFGSIQRALRLLVEGGLVTLDADADSARGRKPYTITPEGVRAWREWMLLPPAGADVERTMLARVFFLGGLDDAADRRQVLAAVRTRAAADLEGLRALAVGAPAAGADSRVRYRLATLDYGIRSLELALAWADELMAEEGR